MGRPLSTKACNSTVFCCIPPLARKRMVQKKGNFKKTKQKRVVSPLGKAVFYVFFGGRGQGYTSWYPEPDVWSYSIVY